MTKINGVISVQGFSIMFGESLPNNIMYNCSYKNNLGYCPELPPWAFSDFDNGVVKIVGLMGEYPLINTLKLFKEFQCQPFKVWSALKKGI